MLPIEITMKSSATLRRQRMRQSFSMIRSATGDNRTQQGHLPSAWDTTARRWVNSPKKWMVNTSGCWDG
jgi:hypothetical protein